MISHFTQWEKHETVVQLSDITVLTKRLNIVNTHFSINIQHSGSLVRTFRISSKRLLGRTLLRRIKKLTENKLMKS